MISIGSAIKNINSNAKFIVKEDKTEDFTVDWLEDTTPISKADILLKQSELQVEYDALDYARLRKAEYPSIEELVVALYDTDDKSAIETKRAEVKAKYPK